MCPASLLCLRSISYEAIIFWCTSQGVTLGNTQTTTITNLRFADDVLLIGKTLHQVKNMIDTLTTETRKHGLQLHPDKTKILHNLTRATGDSKQRYARVGELNIEILPRTEATKYLGRKVSFDQYNQTEIDNRIAAAWKKIWSLKSELTSKRYSLHDRLRLFEGTVTPTFLYGILRGR